MSSALSASVNLLNTIIGAGLLAMPFGIKANGLTLGVFVIIFCACCSMFGLYLQGRCAKYNRPGHSSFFALSQLTYPSLSVLFDLGIAVKCFGVGVSYLVVIGDLLPKIMESLLSDDTLQQKPYLVERNFWISIVMFMVVAPLSFLRKLDSLRYASMVALSSVAYLSILVVEHFLKNDIPNEIKGDVRYFTPYSATSMFSAFPLFVFAYTCHQNMFSLLNELKDKSNGNINKVISSAICTAMFLYIFVGATGYLTFGDNVQGNIIVMYPAAISSTIGRIAIVVLVTLSFPLQCHPARASINHIVHYISVRKIEIESRANSVSSHIQRTASGIFRALSFSSTNSGSNLLTPRASGSRNYSSTNLNSDQQAPLIPNTLNASAPATDVEDEADSLVIPKMRKNKKHATVVELPTKKFIILTTIIVLFSYILALKVRSLEHVLGFVGATGSTSISFILPGIFGYKLIGSDYPIYNDNEEDEVVIDSQDNEDPFSLPIKKVSRADLLVKYLAGALVIWGVCVMIVCLSAVIFLGAGH
ncbi:aspartate/glutamate transporter [Saccharomycopsis crataegensis]|uniref:Aspartate/glutamate transporter n=1 Tax=Saccharomycopsis crataegensis TaxID=43959 RepID=A0AAV5QMZ3_9ASCO|nr:aspartate/glutamate transporter [Saccharomycopsis crataegensis]